MTPVDIIRGILLLIAIHLAMGTVFSVAFHRRGLVTVDPATRGAGMGFRLLVTPGLIALWPIVALRWIQASHLGSAHFAPSEVSSPERLRRSHALLWKALVVLLPGILATALYWRPTPTADLRNSAPEATRQLPPLPSPVHP